MDKHSEMMKIAAAAITISELEGRPLTKLSAGWLARLLGMAPQRTNPLSWILPLVGVGGLGALAYTQRDKLSGLFGDLIDKIRGLGGGGGQPAAIPPVLPNPPGRRVKPMRIGPRKKRKPSILQRDLGTIGEGIGDIYGDVRGRVEDIYEGARDRIENIDWRNLI